jgi:hypothetical protein
MDILIGDSLHSNACWFYGSWLWVGHLKGVHELYFI